MKVSKGILSAFEMFGFSFTKIDEAQRLWDNIEPKLSKKELIYFEDDYLDTEDREYLADLVAKYFTGESWPCYGNTEELRQKFYQRLCEEATKQGYVIKV